MSDRKPAESGDTPAEPEPPYPRLRAFIPKQLRDFGHFIQYEHVEPVHIIQRPSNRERQDLFVEKIFTSVGIQEGCTRSINSTQTELPETETRSVNFVEGAWPKDVQVTDPEQTQRYRKIIEKEEPYITFFTAAGKEVEEMAKDNNIFNYLEQYFDEDEVDVTYQDGFKCQLIAEYHDSTCNYNRKVQDLFFFPKDAGRVAVAYQEIGQNDIPYNDAALFGSIWDVNLLYKPLQNFIPPFRLYSIIYNPKDINSIVGSLWSGQLCQWDLRAGEEPNVITDLDVGHLKICRKVQWLQSKTMTDLVSVGMDGQMIFWDIRKWNEPVEKIILDPNRTKNPAMSDGAPCACVDFDQGIPSRLCAGSEKGYIFNINRKSKSAHEKITWVWKDIITPVLTLQRNPAHPRYMLTVSCDDVKIFADDCRDSWIINTRPQEGHFTCGCWSPTRCGVFVTTQTTGQFCAWDLNRGARCVAPTASLQVDLQCLTCVTPHEEGRLYAVGTMKGTWGVVEVSNALYIPTQKEKTDVGELFEREGRREKILEGRGREKLAAIKKEAAARVEAIALAQKAGKSLPAFEPEDVLDPVYNMPFRPGPIIPPEPAAKKDIVKDKTTDVYQESIRQYEQWVADEDEEMRHNLLPQFFDWQVEDEGPGSIMRKMGERVPRNRGIPTDVPLSAAAQAARDAVPVVEYQLGVDEAPSRPLETVQSGPQPPEPGEQVELPMDFAAETKEMVETAEPQAP
ncbi:dynein intermediate chain 3, ciliary-like [Paramacrobiotus metropolitanus]|uniref:dynein intermediate chain 3, ciliary-like n=1 Tax=Paramacrobiotus metropolitanus TaxID=2943436 RepID=UPI002445E16A|nr:dynein intermediate chain 3, ciliary-like [Paramacrobiotus metropolitanus]